MAGSGLLGALDGTATVDALVDDAALVRALLAVETALARSLEVEDLIPAGTGEAVARAAAGLDTDADDLGRRALAAGNPVVPLVADLGAAVGSPADAWVHHGATSQDVLDTALMLLARDALDVILPCLDGAAGGAAALASTHRDTLALARTLGQPAVPTTFGARAATWCSALDSSARRLRGVRRDELAVQLGGAAGTLSVTGPRGLAVAARLAGQLGLADPGVPWHTDRGRLHVLASTLASAVAACGKVAGDVIALSAQEVAELREGGGDGQGGSSAMPHKRNPVSCVLIVAAARRTPGLVGTLLAAGCHEQERATGSWHAEWEPLRDLLRLTGGAASRTAGVLAELEVDTVRARANLDAAGPGVQAERLAALLTGPVSRQEAHRLVARCLARAHGSGQPLREVLLTDPDVTEALAARGDRLPDDELAAAVDDALDPHAALGAAGAVVDRVLARLSDRLPDLADSAADDEPG